MVDESSEDPPTRSKSVKGYASRVWKESSVSAVSAIVSTGSVPRKVFRALVFVLFMAGFLYQCIKFLSYIFTYPTIVSIEITKPDSYLTPAYTFCNYNKIKRSKFCQKYPDKCIIPDTQFCRMYPLYCGGNDTKIPREEYFFQENDSSENIFGLGHDVDTFLKDKKVGGDEEPSGPYLRLINRGKSGLSACYSFHSRVKSQLEPLMTERQKWWKEPQHTFLFDPEEDEVFSPNGKPGIMFAVHSPFTAVNPFDKGIFLSPGYSYRITISMQEEKLLPYPYKTDCLNYTDIWLKNNKEGPRSQQSCRDLCALESSIYCFNCTHPLILYPNDLRICNVDDELSSPCMINGTKQYEEVDQLFHTCVDKCKDDCLQMKYTYEVSETYIVPEWKTENINKEPRLIQVEIDFEDSEIIALHYRPQFQEVEAFSYIGGFIGIWLGVSLVQIADVFESLFRIARYFCKKGASVCSKETSPTRNETV